MPQSSDCPIEGYVFKDMMKYKKPDGVVPGFSETFTTLLEISGVSPDPASK